MKNKRFKKALSVFLSILMLMSCWVWVAPTDASAAGSYYVRVYLNIYDGANSDGYGKAYSVVDDINSEFYGKPNEYKWDYGSSWSATDNSAGYDGEVNMAGFTLFYDNDKQYKTYDLSADLVAATTTLGNKFTSMDELTLDNFATWPNKVEKVYAFELDSMPSSLFWVNDENNAINGETGFGIHKITVAESSTSQEHILWTGLSGSESYYECYYGTITPTGIITPWDDCPGESTKSFYKDYTTSAIGTWFDPFNAGDYNVYPVNNYLSGGVSASFTVGNSGSSTDIDYIDVGNTNNYYINFTNHSTQDATVIALNNSNYLNGYPGDGKLVIKSGETKSYVLNKSSMGGDGTYVNFAFRYTLDNVYNSNGTTSTEFYQANGIGTWNTTDDSKEIDAAEDTNNTAGFVLYQNDSTFRYNIDVSNRFAVSYGILERASATNGNRTRHVDFNYNYWLESTGMDDWDDTGLRLVARKYTNYRHVFQETRNDGTLSLEGAISNNDASISMADIVKTYTAPTDYYNRPDVSNRPWSYVGSPCKPFWDEQSQHRYGTVYDNNTDGIFRFCGRIFEPNSSTSDPAKIVFTNMTWRDYEDDTATFSGTINVYTFNKTDLRNYVRSLGGLGANWAPMRTRFNDAKWNAYESALQTAMQVLANHKTNQKAVTDAYNNLVAACDALKNSANLVNQVAEVTYTKRTADYNSAATDTTNKYLIMPIGTETAVPSYDAYKHTTSGTVVAKQSSNLKTNFTQYETGINPIDYRYWKIDFAGVDEALAKATNLLNTPLDTYSASYYEKIQDARTALSAFDRDADAWTPTHQSDIDNALAALNELLAHDSTDAAKHQFIEDDKGNYVVKFDDTTHWYECGVCGYKYMHENHTTSATPDSNDENSHIVECTYVDNTSGNTCDFVMTEPHTFANPELARPTDNDKDGVWENGTYTYTCTCGATKEEDAVRADYSELEEAIEALEGIKNDENLSDEAKTVIANTLTKADNLADDLVTAEQDQIDNLVKELQKVKADADEAIKNKELGVEKITEATSGVKVQFIDSDGLGKIENVQLGKDDGFKIRVANGNADSNITITNIQGDGISETDDQTIESGKSTDFDVTMPTTAGIKEYTITYTIDGLRDAEGNAVEFTTKAYLYVKGEAYKPYHLMDETCNNGPATAKWEYSLESSVGDFAPVYNNKAPKAEFGNSNLVVDKDWVRPVYHKYDYEDNKCFAECTGTGDTPYVKGDAHAATYRYYIDTSLAPTWQEAGFKAVIAEGVESKYDYAVFNYIRLANNKAYLDSIKGDNKTFSVTVIPGASSNVPTKTWTATSTGDAALTVSDTSDIKDFFKDNEYLFGNYLDEAQTIYTAYTNFSGNIPQSTDAAKMMFSYRIGYNMAEDHFLGGVQAESTTMTTHLYITSYDKAALREAVANAEQAGFNSEYFNSETYKAYEDALKTAKEVLGKAETNQAEIDAATAALNTAIENLNKADAEAKFILTVIHEIHDGADRNSEEKITEYDYYLVNGDITPAQIDLTDMQINKKSDIANLTITEDTEYTYYYWYIDYSAVQGAIDAAEEFINNADDYSEEFIADVTAKKEALEDILDNKDATTTPESQSEVDDAIKAVTDLTGHTCADNDKDHKCDTCGATMGTHADVDPKDHNCDYCGGKLTDCTDGNNDHNCDVCGNKLTDCADGNNDHKCDTCGTTLSTCADGNNDHNCDTCGTELSKCADGNNDHNCDVCGDKLTDCADGDNNHKCDVCGKKLSECADTTTDNDHSCDICGKADVTEHEFVNPALTRPTYNNETGEWTNGVYTSTCNCGTTETTNIARADYEEYDAVKVALEVLLANDKLTQAAKDKITAALETNKIDDNYVATAEEQKLIDDAAAALNVTLGEINAGINDGSMVYVDLSAYNAALEIYNNTTKKVAKDADMETAQTAINSVAGIDATSTKANGNQDKINTATATLAALNEKYAKCAQNEHSYETETTAPTCTAQGYTTYTCKVCGHAYTSNFVNANGHAWGEWNLTTAPTKDTEGTYTRICSKDDATETKSVAREDYSAYDETVKKAEDLLEDETLTTEAKDVIQNALDKAKELDQNLPADVVVDDEIIIDNDSAEKIKNAADTLEEAIKSLYDENGKLKAEYEKVNLTEYNAAVNAYESLKDKMSEADKNAVAEAMKSVTDAKIDENTSKADGQDILDEATAKIVEINAKYGNCAAGNHTWGEPVLTKKPTATEQGEYTETCGVCGETQTTKVDLADYNAFNTVVSQLQNLAKTENLTAEAAKAIADALAKADALDKNLPADATTADGKVIKGGQDKIDALVAELNKVITDTNAAITDGSALKPDYANWEIAEGNYDALDKKNVKDDIIAEVNGLKNTIAGKQSDETLTQATATQKDINDATARLNQIIEGINDGSLRDPDYSAVENKITEAKGNDNLNKDTQDKIKDIEEELQKIKDKTEPEANAKDDQPAVDELEDQLDEILKDIADNSAKAPDYTNWDAAEGTYDALDKTNISETLINEATGLKNTIDALKADPTANAKEDQATIDDATARLNEIITEINGILNEKPDFTGYDALHDEYEKLVAQYGDKIKDSVAEDVSDLDEIVDGVRTDETATKIKDQSTVDNAKTQLDTIINGIKDGSLRDPDYSAVENKINEAKGNDNLNKDTQDKIKDIEEELQKIKDKTEPEANAKDDQDDVDALKDQLDEILDSIANGTATAPDYTKWDVAEEAYDDFTAEELQNVKTEILDEVTALKNTINTLKADPTANAKDDQKTVNDATTRLNQIIEGINNGSLLNPDDGECKHTSTEYVVDNSNGDKLSTHSLKCKACGEILSTEACTFTTKTVEATCHSEGYTVYSCTVCSYGFRADFTELLPHTYSNWQLVEISCTEVATMTRECIVEGCLAQESKPAKDENGKPVYGMHTLVVVEGKAATCLNDGYTDYTYCVVCNKRTDSTVLPATGHKDDNHNGNCDLCSRPMNPAGHCSCFCHGDSFFEKLLFRIINFFWKLFKINRNCDCGANHW